MRLRRVRFNVQIKNRKCTYPNWIILIRTNFGYGNVYVYVSNLIALDYKVHKT